MKKLFAILVLLSTALMFSQKASVLDGNIKNLKGITQYDLVFDYTDVTIPKYDSEEEFLEDKMEKRDEKDPEAGAKFKKAWFGDREEHYEPKFIESFNKRFEDEAVKVGKNLGSEYVMKVHTTLLYAGYNVGVMRQNAKIDAIISVYKKSDPSKLVYSVQYTRAEGGSFMGTDFDSGVRISECYAKLAKTLAAEIKKKAK